MSSPIRLLIVDDEESVALTLKAVLRQDGCEVITAGSIALADATLAKEAFDVALIDLRLGDEDGIEVLRLLRSKQPNCVAILLTGYASLESAVAAMRLGAYDYLIKPCDIEELKPSIRGASEKGAMVKALGNHLERQRASNTKIRSRGRKLQGKLDQLSTELDQKIKELGELKDQFARDTPLPANRAN